MSLSPLPELLQASNDTLVSAARANALIRRVNALSKIQVLPSNAGSVMMTEAGGTIITLKGIASFTAADVTVHNLGTAPGGSTSAKLLVDDPDEDEIGICAPLLYALSTDRIALEADTDARTIRLRQGPLPEALGTYLIIGTQSEGGETWVHQPVEIAEVEMCIDGEEVTRRVLVIPEEE